jgi:hypothetical protein
MDAYANPKRGTSLLSACFPLSLLTSPLALSPLQRIQLQLQLTILTSSVVLPKMANEDTFASGRYLKRKRNQVNYHMPELDVDDSDTEAEAETDKAVAKTDQSDADADADADAYASHSDPGTDQPDSDSESGESGSDAEYGAKAVTKVYPIFKVCQTCSCCRL